MVLMTKNVTKQILQRLYYLIFTLGAGQEFALYQLVIVPEDQLAPVAVEEIQNHQKNHELLCLIQTGTDIETDEKKVTGQKLGL